MGLAAGPGDNLKNEKNDFQRDTNHAANPGGRA